jgi:hypothetical protein
MNVVEHYRHAVARSLCEADIPRDYSFEYLPAKETPKVRSNLFRERGAIIIHRE